MRIDAKTVVDSYLIGKDAHFVALIDRPNPKSGSTLREILTRWAGELLVVEKIEGAEFTGLEAAVLLISVTGCLLAHGGERVREGVEAAWGRVKRYPRNVEGREAARRDILAMSPEEIARRSLAGFRVLAKSAGIDPLRLVRVEVEEPPDRRGTPLEGRVRARPIFEPALDRVELERWGQAVDDFNEKHGGRPVIHERER